MWSYEVDSNCLPAVILLPDPSSLTDILRESAYPLLFSLLWPKQCQEGKTYKPIVVMMAWWQDPEDAHIVYS